MLISMHPALHDEEWSKLELDVETIVVKRLTLRRCKLVELDNWEGVYGPLEPAHRGFAHSSPVFGLNAVWIVLIPEVQEVRGRYRVTAWCAGCLVQPAFATVDAEDPVLPAPKNFCVSTTPTSALDSLARAAHRDVLIGNAVVEATA
jgi:hypothetical protein